MTWLYLLAATALCLAPLASALPEPASILPLIGTIA